MVEHTHEQKLTVAQAKQALRDRVRVRTPIGGTERLIELSRHHPLGFPVAAFSVGFILGTRRGRRLITYQFNRLLGLDAFNRFARDGSTKNE